MHVKGSTFCNRRTDRSQESSNMDIIMIAIGVIFFALSLAYVRACDNL